MKKNFKFITIFAIVLMLVPFPIVNASPKTEAIIEKLVNDESLKSINGTITYEDGLLQLGYSIPNSTYSEVSFPYKDNIIEYSPN